MRVSFVEWPDGLRVDSSEWSNITHAIADERPDVLVTNEMPFGTWLASTPRLDLVTANRSVHDHEEGIEALHDLKVPLVVTSRPIWQGQRLANEAVALKGGATVALHRKHYFPDEPGWFEGRWFAPGDGTFQSWDAGSLSVGVLLCTEAMFNEHARGYGVQGATLIALPRATGQDLQPWLTAGAMAALVSGAYVVSSNRVGKRDGPTFGGGGFAFAPDGTLIEATNRDRPILTITLDPAVALSTQRDGYPCYVARAAANPASPVP